MRVNEDGILGETLENGLQVFGLHRSKIPLDQGAKRSIHGDVPFLFVYCTTMVKFMPTWTEQ